VFLRDLLRPSSAILEAGAQALLSEQQRTSDGRPVPMTLGWHIGELQGVRCFYKEGGGGGFHSMMRLYPDRGLGTVVIANATGFAAEKTVNHADPHFF
jgi:hypothetical protein